MAVSGAFLIFMYGLTFHNPVLNETLTSAVLLGIIGFSLGFVICKAELTFRLELARMILWTAVSVVTIYTLNRIVPLRLEIVALDARLFAVLCGVMEELFFRLWLCPMIYLITKSKFLAIASVALVGTVYHLARYGGNWSALIIVFGCFAVLNVVVLESQSADPTIFSHGVINYFAVPQ